LIENHSLIPSEVVALLIFFLDTGVLQKKKKKKLTLVTEVRHRRIRFFNMNWYVVLVVIILLLLLYQYLCPSTPPAHSHTQKCEDPEVWYIYTSNLLEDTRKYLIINKQEIEFVDTHQNPVKEYRMGWKKQLSSEPGKFFLYIQHFETRWYIAQPRQGKTYHQVTKVHQKAAKFSENTLLHSINEWNSVDRDRPSGSHGVSQLDTIRFTQYH
jgi:hypothetical protein